MISKAGLISVLGCSCPSCENKLPETIVNRIVMIIVIFFEVFLAESGAAGKKA
jgi:hypothetical protein